MARGVEHPDGLELGDNFRELPPKAAIAYREKVLDKIMARYNEREEKERAWRERESEVDR